MSNVPDSPVFRPSARGVGALIAVAILLVLGAILFWQRMANTISEIRVAQQRDATQLSDLQKQLSAEQGERKQLADQLGALSARLESILKTNAAEPSASPEGPKRRRAR